MTGSASNAGHVTDAESGAPGVPGESTGAASTAGSTAAVEPAAAESGAEESRAGAAEASSSSARLDLAPHSERCLGCGPDNPAGMGMHVQREGDTVVTDIVFQPRHVGAPGLAHGGAVATVCDDLFGFVLYVVSEPAVTRTLEVDYHSPAVLGTSYQVRAWLDHRDGRRLHLRATGTDPTGRECFQARAVFVVVPLAHFQRYGAAQFSHVFPDAAPTDPPPAPPAPAGPLARVPSSEQQHFLEGDQQP